MTLDIVISNTSGEPIYEQIKQQLKAAILRGDLPEGDALPSIRGLARDLRVSVITTTRAYSDLAQEGFVTNVPGKGSYVLPRDTDLVREQILREVETHFADGLRKARLAALTPAELHAVLDALIEQEL
ncbi:GntR family transcriptional regulator [Tessaracoccus sp. MC1756]|uniref:GntR family transcriptional regulator n=1 Tax=Tessaracoccus sp. MC1756 TaxID=2760311 RepID=UPI001603E54F|nr:GntR family transcriptional regulator [Tessaracoccus sp. MC1756]